MKICGKDYIVPELTFEHAEQLENETGKTLYEVVFGNNTMAAARAFVQIVTGEDAETVRIMLNQHLTDGGYKALGVIVDEFVKAVFDSDFFCGLLGLPKKAEREKQAREKVKQEPDQESFANDPSET